MNFRGTYVALVTPFRGGALDEDSLGRLTEHVVGGGVNGLVACGCTGEAATLSVAERERVLEVVKKAAGGKAQIVMGTGTNSTAGTSDLTTKAADWGADAVMVICPYYNKPTQDGLYSHFHAVAEGSSLPVMLYNVPSRTGVNLLPETVVRLSSHDRIAAIKEASGSVDQTSAITSACDTAVLSGDDSLTLPILSVGGQGVVSVVANLLPKATSSMVSSFLSGDATGAGDLHRKLFPVCKAMFIETNPAPIKAALYMKGLIKSPELRLPLVGLRKESEDKLAKVLESAGGLN